MTTTTRISILAISFLLAVAGGWTVAWAQQAVCPDLDTGHLTPPDETHQVTYTAPDGYLVDAYCYKAGTNVVMLGVQPPAETVTIESAFQQAISHYSISLVEEEPSTTTTTTPTTSSSTSTTTTIGPTTTTTTTLPPSTTTTGVAPTITTTTVGVSTTVPPSSSTTLCPEQADDPTNPCGGVPAGFGSMADTSPVALGLIAAGVLVLVAAAGVWAAGWRRR